MRCSAGSRLKARPAKSAPMAIEKPRVSARAAIRNTIPAAKTKGPTFVSRPAKTADSRCSASRENAKHSALKAMIFTTWDPPLTAASCHTPAFRPSCSDGATANTMPSRITAEISSSSATSRRSAPSSLSRAPLSSHGATETPMLVALDDISREQRGHRPETRPGKDEREGGQRRNDHVGQPDPGSPAELAGQTPGVAFEPDPEKKRDNAQLGENLDLILQGGRQHPRPSIDG